MIIGITKNDVAIVKIADGRGYRTLSPTRCNGSGQRSIFSRPLTTQHNKHGIRSPTAGQRYEYQQHKLQCSVNVLSCIHYQGR